MEVPSVESALPTHQWTLIISGYPWLAEPNIPKLFSFAAEFWVIGAISESRFLILATRSAAIKPNPFKYKWLKTMN